jgi:hypothetical protein
MSRGSTKRVAVTFNTEDDQELVCKYECDVILGNYSAAPENCYPDEVEPGEPDYYLDGEWIKEDDLPAHLQQIAVDMYERGNDDSRFIYKEIEDYG